MKGPKGVFLKEFGDAPNLITPNVIEYGWIKGGKIAYELSVGSDFDRKPMYGVTIVSVNEDGTTTSEHDLCESFVGEKALRDAKKYIKTLKQG